MDPKVLKHSVTNATIKTSHDQAAMPHLHAILEFRPTKLEIPVAKIGVRGISDTSCTRIDTAVKYLPISTRIY